MYYKVDAFSHEMHVLLLMVSFIVTLCYFAVPLVIAINKIDRPNADVVSIFLN